MSHTVAEQAALAVKNSQKATANTRTPEQRLADIRKNRAAKLFVTPDDQDFLLAALDEALKKVSNQSQTIQDLSDELDSVRGTAV
jgi:hypothetical protein